MPDVVVYSGSTAEARLSSGGQRIVQKANRQGDAYVADQLAHYAAQGLIFKASTGLTTTPVTFKTGFTLLQPELAVDCPASKAILPIHLEIYLETTAGTINEVVLQSTTSALGAGTSTAVTIQNGSRSDAPASSACSAFSLYSGNGAAQTGINQLWRSGYAFVDVTAGPIKKFEADVRQNLIPYWVVGTGGLQVYAGATGSAATGYITLYWAEVPVTDITG